MKIYVLGSTSFVKEMVNAVGELKKLGHEGWIHPHYVDYVNQENHPHFARYENGEHAQIKIENDYLNQHYKNILESDAVLVINFEKKGIPNYIGGATFLEIYKAFELDKKIFFYNPIPICSFTDELIAIDPIIINRNLEVIRWLVKLSKQFKNIKKEYW